MNDHGLLGPADAARRLGVSRRTLEGWRLKAGGPRYVKLSPGRGGRCRYSIADLEAWLAERTRSSATNGGAS